MSLPLSKLVNVQGAKQLYDDLRVRIEEKYTLPETGIPASDISEDVLNSKAPVILDSVSGNFLTFPDGADNMPLESLVVNLLPKQDGSGDVSPQNIRPISGWTGLDVNAGGKNLFDKNGTGVIDAYIAIEKIANLAVGKSVYIKCKPNTTYTISKTAGQRFVVAYTKVVPAHDVDIYGRTSNDTGSSLTFTTGADAEYLVAFIYNSNYDTGTADDMVASVQIEVGSQASAYEAYKPIVNNSIDWTDEAGTVYGCSYDAISGVLAVVYEGHVTTWGDCKIDRTVSGYQEGRIIFDNPIIVSGQAGSNKAKCSVAPLRWADFDGTIHFYTGVAQGQYRASVYFPTDTPDEMEIQVIAPLITPIIIQLDPITIRSLLGYNTIWSDANGGMTAVYRADTKLFCQKNDTVDDVQVNGTSVVQNGVANIPMATNDTPGVAKVYSSYGVSMNNNGFMTVTPATLAIIKAGTDWYKPLGVRDLNASIFYGLAKLAGADMANSSNAVGTYTDAAKHGIQKIFGFDNLLGPYESDSVADQAYDIGDPFIFNGKQYTATAAIDLGDVLAPGTNCELARNDQVYVKKTDYAANGVYGLVKIGNEGINVSSAGNIRTVPAGDSSIKGGTVNYNPIVPLTQHTSTFYGLAKASGDTTQSASSNAVGNYTPEAKQAIQNMLGVADKNTLNEKAPVIYDSVSGNPITFTDGAESIPIKDFTIEFLPKQEGTDDPSPTNIRELVPWNECRIWHTDKNLLSINRSTDQETQGIKYTPIRRDNKTIAVRVKGERTNNNPFFNLNWINSTSLAIQPGTYKIYGGNSNIRIQVFYYDSEGKETLAGVDTGEGATITIPSDALGSWCRLLTWTDDPVDEVIYPMLLSADSTAVSYSVTFPALGKNLAGMKYSNKVPSISSGQMVDQNGWSTPFIPVDTSKAYYLSRNSSTGNIYVLFYDSEYNFISCASIGGEYSARVDNLTGFSSCSYIKLRNDSAKTATVDVQLEQNTQATSYEPFMNSIYGGILNPINGILKITHVYKVFKWSDGVNASVLGTNERRVFYLPENTYVAPTSYPQIGDHVCNIAKWQWNYTNDTNHYYVDTNGTCYVFMPTDTDNDEEIQIANKLSTPIEVSIDPILVTTFAGNNTIWTDTNDIALITYCADTKLFCEKNDTVDDVKVNNVSIVQNGVANVPIATASTPGVVCVRSTSDGLFVDGNNRLNIAGASDANLKAGSTNYRAITPFVQHKSVFYGLSKLAGVDLAEGSDTVGVYPGSAKQSIQKMFGLNDIIGPYEMDLTADKAYAVGDPMVVNGKLYKATTALALGDVIAPGTNCEPTTIADLFVKKTDYASNNNFGLTKGNLGAGIGVDTVSHTLYVNKAADSWIKTGTNIYAPIVSANLPTAIYYGLSKLAGADLANETVTVGTYPATSQTAILSMLGAVKDVQIDGTSVLTNGVANIPAAGAGNISASTLGVVKGGYGVKILNGGILSTDYAYVNDVKNGTSNYLTISPSTVPAAAFYGLSKVAGVDLANETVTLGQYPQNSKAAIQSMLGIEADIPLVETVTGSTPSITGMPNVRYICSSSLSSLAIIPPASGTIVIRFTAGSNCIVTTSTTVNWPSWFDITSLTADTTYELIITDGIYGAVMSWA